MRNVRIRGLGVGIALAAAIAVGPAAAFADPEPGPAAVDQAADRLAAEAPPPAPVPWTLDPRSLPSSTSAAVPVPGLDAGPPVPGPRRNATAIVDPVRNRLLLFGGSYNSEYQYGPILNDVWALPLTGPPIWTQLAPAGDSLAGGLPAPRFAHVAIYDPVRDRMIVFGSGQQPGQNDVWALGLSGDPAWTKLAPAGTAPLPRIFASAVYDPVRDRMILFGGVSLYQWHNDVWALSLSGTPTWSPIDPPIGPAGERPSGRYAQTAIYDPVRDRIVICGGEGGDNNAWALPLSGTEAWQRLATPGSSPLPRQGQSAIYDPTADRMVLFGGSTGYFLLNDTWALPLSGDPVWSRIVSPTPTPAPRGAHVAVFDPAGGRMVVFGGPALNDTWALPLTGSPAWSMIQPLAPPAPTAPVPVFADTITGIPATLFVGQSFTLRALVRNDGVTSDDGRIVFGFPSLTDPADRARVSSPTAGDAPGFRVHAAGSAVDGAACQPVTASYLVAEYADDHWAEFGGETQRFDLRVTPRTTGTFTVEVRSTMHAAGGPACDPAGGLPANGDPGPADQQGFAVRRFTITVLPLPPPGSAPVRRRLHSAIHDPVRNRMLVFGGWTGAPNGETWALSLGATPTWSLLLTDAGPSARYGHSAIYDPVRDRMIVFGGFDDARRNDVWALSLTGPLTWTQIFPAAGPAPAPRRYHSAIYDPVRDRMIVFGGAAGVDMNDVWAFDLKEPHWTQLPGGPSWRKYTPAVYDPVRDRMLIFGGAAGSATLYDDLWALHLSGPAWAPLAPAGGLRPTARSGHTFTYDAARDRFWLVGGYTGAEENDAWTYSPSSGAWEEVGPWGAPMGGRELHTTIADPGADRLVTYGGTDTLGRLGDTWFLSRALPPTWQKLGGSPPPPPPPDPRPVFTSRVGVIPATITLGQTFQVTVRVRNDLLPSDDGRIVIGLPEFTAPGDTQWVSVSPGPGVPGAIESPAGSIVRSSTCQPMAAPYLSAEYADSSWQGFGSEAHAVTFTVQPRTVGAFHFDLRATMHRAGDAGCALTTAVPDSGEGGATDAQGFPVMRFTVAVLPAGGAALPVFSNGNALSRDHITLGQTFTMDITTRNAGAVSDDGRIVLGFPGFTSPDDSANVSCARGEDIPGYRELPVGTMLSDSTCAPVVAAYLTAEYVDNDWTGLNTESNRITVTIRPRAAGPFVVTVRSTMRTAGLGVCDYVNGLPLDGAGGFSDPQGWAVKRYVVMVDPPPTAARPTIQGLTLTPTAVVQSQSFTLSIHATNLGAASDDGRIVVGFPSFTDSADVNQVTGYVDYDYDRSEGLYRELPAGSAAVDSSCAPVSRGHLAVEAHDSDWKWVDEEDHDLTLVVTPRAVGTFYVDIRTTMRTAGAGGCAYVNAAPPGSGEWVADEQGWTVLRLAVTVGAQPAPVPVLAGFYATPTPIALGQTFTISATASNTGWDSDGGRMCISFPSLTALADTARVVLPNPYDHPGWFLRHPVGDTIPRSDCVPIPASYLMVERAEGWPAQQQKALLLNVTPRDTGTFVVQFRATMHWSAEAPCAYLSAPQGGATDQQGWWVRTLTVHVDPPPGTRPSFTGVVSAYPGAISLGESFTISTSVRNEGAGSNDGHISFGFPTLRDPADAQWVSFSPAPDLPGPVARPAGSSLNTARCQSVVSDHLVADYVDNDWQPGETNTVLLSVQPQAEGTFTFDVRATMRDTSLFAGPCTYPNAVPVDGAAGITDAQGWPVKRFAIQVGPSLGPPSVRWAPVSAGTPAPSERASQAAVYDEVRDELVLYGGGVALRYVGDSWRLPLGDGSSWNQLSPGGPVPQLRIGHSMVFNAETNQLLIFGGFYDTPLNDLWVLARVPIPWWFPISVSGVRPPPRMGHAAIFDPVRKRMLVIGGYDGTALLDDVWEYSPMVNGTWKRITPAGPAPPPRLTFSAVYDPVRDRVVVFGGDGGYVLGDLWELRLSGTPTWAPIAAGGISPGPRREHTAVYDPQFDEMVLFGGFDGTRRLNDLWTLSLSGTPHWERRVSLTPSPAPRSGHSAVYDMRQQRMVIFGGQVNSSAYTSDVWELRIDRATPVALSLAATEVESDHVRLTWFGVGAASLSASVERSAGPGEWVEVGAASAQGPDQLVFLDRDVVPGTRYAYRLRVWQDGKEEVLGPVWVDVPVRAELSLTGASPNPASDVLTIAFSLPAAGEGALELFDLRGRRLALRDLAGMAPGPHRVALADARHLAAGVYWVRLTHGGRQLTAKAAVVR
jgi:hypothetical protein